MNKRAALASPKRHLFCGRSIKLTREGSPSNDENEEDEENVTAAASERLRPKATATHHAEQLAHCVGTAVESVTTKCISVRPILLVLLVKVIKVRLVRVRFRLIGIKLNGE